MTEELRARQINWDALWEEDRKRSLHRNDRAHWDKRAPSFAKHVSEGSYTKQFLKLLLPEPHWSVLDVGCGAGTLAIPLAKQTKCVTAIDFSPVMIELLRAGCRENAIDNVKAVLGSWEDDWSALGIAVHDVAIASRSFAIENPRAAIGKLNSFARKRAYISAPVADGPFDRRLFRALGREWKPRPDYIYTYNILYQMNIFANVAFITSSRNKTYESRESAYESVRWMFQNISEDEDRKLRAFLSEHLVPHGSGVRLDYDRSVRWAVMWWDIPQ